MQKNRLWVWKESYKLERFEFINITKLRAIDTNFVAEINSRIF